MASATIETRAARLKWLAIIGATVLMFGVLIFCHAELRGAWYIQKMNAILDDIFSQANDTAQQAAFEKAFFTAQSRERMSELWDSFFRERWLGHRVVAPLGAGILSGSLAGLALFTAWRFRLRTLLLATIYVALLIGIPFGIVRPRLHDPHVSVRVGPDIDRTFVRYYQGSTRRGGGPRWSFALVDWRNLLVAAAAAVAAPTVALPRRICPTST
jgi:hypothetical protein